MSLKKKSNSSLISGLSLFITFATAGMTIAIVTQTLVSNKDFNKFIPRLANFPEITSISIATATALMSVTLSRYLDVSKEKEEIKEKYFREISNRLGSLKELESSISEKYQKKKQRFLDIPVVTFHYIDEERIKNFYKDYFTEPTVETLVAKTMSEISGDTKANIPKILESKLGAKNLTELVSSMRFPEESISSMFLRYQREILNKNQVTLGIEEVELELSELEEFEKLVDNIKQKYDLGFDEDKLNQQKIVLKEKAAEQTFKKLESSSGAVLIEGKFLIQDENHEYYKLTYPHPVNDYSSDKKVYISIKLKKNLLSEAFSSQYPQLAEKAIPLPLKIYGEILVPIDRALNYYELLITPFAVY